MKTITILFISSIFIITGCEQATQESGSANDLAGKKASENLTNSQLEETIKKTIPVPEDQFFSLIFNGVVVGNMQVTTKNDSETNLSTISVDYRYSNNGRGEDYKEQIMIDPLGFPMRWTVEGNTTFGNAINESYSLVENSASWTDATGSETAEVTEPTLYVPQFGGDYESFILANALLLDDDHTLPLLPAGEINLKRVETIEIEQDSQKQVLSSYALSGVDLNPSYFVLDQQQHLFAYITPRFIAIRKNFEQHEADLRKLSEKYSAKRYEQIQAEVAHQYDTPVRIRDVRVFDPKSLSLTEAVSVIVEGERIIAIEPLSVATKNHETEIDASGGTLIAGLYDMHGHMGDEQALLNVVAGVTSVRDMGNANDVLDGLIEKIDKGILAGPRITRYGFIEGKSSFSANGGIIVESLEQALEAVRTYSEKGFPAVKLYNSMQGEWAPAIAKEAHRLNMSVAGHVPAFSNANAMIDAGYDEMTHINQVMLGWVLTPEEDTRTLFRITGMSRFAGLDLNSEKVQTTINKMVSNNVAIDPTMAIHEFGLTARNGEVRAGVVDYFENMPPAVQRNSKVALLNVGNEKEDKDYREAYQQIIRTVKMMKDRGIQLIPGTDLGGGFNLHRELEIYQVFGMSPAEVIKLGSSDMAEYLGHNDLGSIEPNKLADFFLVPGDPTKDFKEIKKISMVSKGGVFYFPTEIYPKFGIKPFTKQPSVRQAINQ